MKTKIFHLLRNLKIFQSMTKMANLKRGTLMTNQDLVKDIFRRGNCVNIQVINDPNPVSEDLLFVDPRAITEQELLARVQDKFGEQNWVRLDFKHYISTYCPEDISDELKENKLTLIEYYDNARSSTSDF